MDDLRNTKNQGRSFLDRLFLTLGIFLAMVMGSLSARATSWLVVDIGIIGASSQDILQVAMSQVRSKNHEGLIVRLDTPGGTLDSTRVMVKDIMAAEFPVVVWVGPSGSRAGSAGAFITLAAHLAAMAPGTHIGAAHPVSIGIGGGAESDEEGGEIARKAENDTIAFMESIAENRGRNLEMARSFVATSVSITAEEALQHKVIDLVSRDLSTLMADLHGRTLTLAGDQKVTLNTKDAIRVVFEKSLRQRLLEILANPNLFYLLFLCGLAGIGYELTHPGLILPGVVGSISLILAMVATATLPVSFGAAALMVVGIGMLVAEAFVPSFGALGIGGFSAFVIGSIFLVDPTNEAGLRISLSTIVPGAVVMGGSFLGLGFLLVKSLRSTVSSGPESLIHAEGHALRHFVEGKGPIRVQGAIWSASSADISEGILKGDRVLVIARKNLELTVKKIQS